MSGPSPRQIAALAVEIHTKRGLGVKAVHQDSTHRFRVALEGRKGRIDVVLDVDPAFPRIHLAAPRPAPAAPSPLASILRRNLRAAKFEGARAVPGERAVVLVFRRGGKMMTLWFEAFGRRANLYFVGTDGRVVLTPRGDVAKTRKARVGDTFVPVPPARREAGDAPAAPPAESGVSAEVEAEARATDRDQDLARRRTEVVRRFRREVKRAEGRVGKLTEQGARGADAARLQHEAELLQASFHLLEPGAKHVRVPDHTEPEAPEVEIDVDPRLEPGEQVAGAFRAARKAARAGEEAEARLPEAQAALEKARMALRTAEAAQDLEALQALEDEVGAAAGGAPRPKGEPTRARPWREFRSVDGWRILVGKNARANDELTLREAKPQDLFLHARGAGGSHVIVPTPRGKTVPRDTLLDAAQLAMLYSTLREAGRCEVDYAPRRYVSKPKKAPPGEVCLQRTKTLSVRREEERRTRLRASRRK